MRACLTRRRFMTICAAAALPRQALAEAPVTRWRGAALGAEASMTLVGIGGDAADEIFAATQAEIEPFKTAMSMRFMRAWPFVLFAVALLVAGLFIERFYCRYLCPLGAALAIPAKLKLFDWLRRRPQCGRECRLCETRCMVGAIDPIGRINPNECVLCLHCQTIYHDPNTCLVLKRRARPTAPTAPENTL